MQTKLTLFEDAKMQVCPMKKNVKNILFRVAFLYFREKLNQQILVYGQTPLPILYSCDLK